MDKFLGTHKSPKLTQEEIKNLNTSITSKEIESIIKNPSTKKVQNQNLVEIAGEVYQTLKEELTRILLKLLQKNRLGVNTS